MSPSRITSHLIARQSINTRARALFSLNPHPKPRSRWRTRSLGTLAACSLGLAQAVVPLTAGEAATPASTGLAPFGVVGAPALATIWQFTGLLAKPHTRFDMVTLEGEPALQVSTDNSYGAIAHPWHGPTPAQLEWRWRVDQPLLHTDITTKAGDDAALKVCVMFDQPRADIPLLQRAGLALARAASGQEIPNATLCYVWDSHYPAGTSGTNPFSARVRYIVLDGRDAPLAHWSTQRRRVADDFQLLFGKETPITPPVVAVAVGADSDNTHDQSRAYLSQLHWLP